MWRSACQPIGGMPARSQHAGEQSGRTSPGSCGGPARQATFVCRALSRCSGTIGALDRPARPLNAYVNDLAHEVLPGRSVAKKWAAIPGTQSGRQPIAGCAAPATVMKAACGNSASRWRVAGEDDRRQVPERPRRRHHRFVAMRCGPREACLAQVEAVPAVRGERREGSLRERRQRRRVLASPHRDRVGRPPGRGQVATQSSGPLPPKEMGVILGVAVLLDALLVRLVLIPVALRLLGPWAWWLPSWGDRLLPDVRFGHS